MNNTSISKEALIEYWSIDGKNNFLSGEQKAKLQFSKTTQIELYAINETFWKILGYEKVRSNNNIFTQSANIKGKLKKIFETSSSSWNELQAWLEQTTYDKEEYQLNVQKIQTYWDNTGKQKFIEKIQTWISIWDALHAVFSQILETSTVQSSKKILKRYYNLESMGQQELLLALWSTNSEIKQWLKTVNNQIKFTS